MQAKNLGRLNVLHKLRHACFKRCACQYRSALCSALQCCIRSASTAQKALDESCCGDSGFGCGCRNRGGCGVLLVLLQERRRHFIGIVFQHRRYSRTVRQRHLRLCGCFSGKKRLRIVLRSSGVLNRYGPLLPFSKHYIRPVKQQI